MAVTISTHNGSAVRREHNIRNKYVAAKQTHIDPYGHYEIWKDEKPREAYHRIFDSAVERYNQRQKRQDRKIADYYRQIEKDEKKHTVYEMIIGIYGKDINNIPECPEEIGKKIMQEFTDGWEKRNPNLELIGAYYHADEEGEPHVHLDYIPVAHGYKNGMDTQNGLVKALGEMGFVKSGKMTAQILWEARENDVLDKLCQKYGLTVLHPERGQGIQHVHTERFKVEKDLEAADRKLNTTQDQLNVVQDILEIKNNELQSLSGYIKWAGKNISTIQEEFEFRKKYYENEIQEKQRKLDDLKAEESISNISRSIMERITKFEFSFDGIVKEIPEKNGIIGYQEAQIVIKKSAFNRLVKAASDKAKLELIKLDMEKYAVDMKKSADTIYRNQKDTFRQIKDEEMNFVEQQLMDAKRQILDDIAEMDTLKQQFENEKLTLINKINMVHGILAYFPDLWDEMQEKTKKAMEMEHIYLKKMEHKQKNIIQRYYFEGREFTEYEFLIEYDRECKLKNIHPNKEMKNALLRKESKWEKNRGISMFPKI